MQANNNTCLASELIGIIQVDNIVKLPSVLFSVISKIDDNWAG